MRLDKYISMNGPTRKQARDMVKAGRLSVNGVIARDVAMNVSFDDDIRLDGAPLGAKKELYVMINKPAGMLTATEDAHGAPTVIDLLPENLKKRDPGPVGRLDKDVTGLVLMTTDGQLAHRLISPKRHVTKIYRAIVEGTPDEADCRRFTEGIPLSDFGAIEHPVQKLWRLSIGGVTIDPALAEGEWRELTDEEVATLKTLSGMDED